VKRRAVSLAVGAALIGAVLGGGTTAAEPPERDLDKADELQLWADAEVDRPDERVAVELLLDGTRPDAAGDAARAVRSLGGRVTGAIPGHLVQASVPADTLDALRQADGVVSVRRPLRQDLPLGGASGPFLQLITGDQVGHTNADAWHAAGHTGAGVKIGIVDGFRGTTWQAAVASGDLPEVDAAHTMCQLAGDPCDIWATGIAHGVAVAEIVHEVAPDAELYLATALTAADLMAAVDWFIANGVTVVNRSLGAELDGPGDGTGPLGAVADQAVAAGISWFNSAGNEAGRDGRQGNYYRAPFTDTDGDGWHEFVNPYGPLPAGGPFEDLAMDCGGNLLSSLRWSDWDDLAGATDYDLYVFSTPGGNRYHAGFDTDAALAHPDLVTAAFAEQGPGGAPPLERLGGTCSGGTVYLAIHRYAANNGTTGDTLEIMAEADLETWSNPYSAGYPIVDSANPGVFGIGSVAADHTIAYYSSEGPTNDGRIKPDFTARSGVHTVGLPTFNGTSASAPAAAGLAALVLGAGHASSPAELREWLTNHAAVDRGACGPDTVYGYGELVLPDPEAPADPADPHLACAARFEPLAPTRVFDSRPGEPAPGPKGKLAHERTVDVQVAGVGGVADEAGAVVLNVTVTEPAAAGYVTVYPSGAARPLASAVNVVEAEQTRAATVTVPLGSDGRVTLFTKSAAHLIVDVAGYYVSTEGAPVAGGRFVAATPTRLFDTRPSEPGAGPKGLIDARQHVDVDVLGRAGVPSTDVAAVVVNLTGTEAVVPGYLTVFPAGGAVPLASTVNLGAPGATAANLTIVPLGTGGRISVYSSHGAHALADVVGYITSDTAAVDTAGLFVPLTPTRVFDTRSASSIPAGGTITRQVAGIAGVPAAATAVVLSVAGVDSKLGYLTMWDTGVPRPLASTVNFTHQPLDTRANGAMLRLGSGGRLDVYSKYGGHVLADVTGYFLW